LSVVVDRDVVDLPVGDHNKPFSGRVSSRVIVIPDHLKNTYENKSRLRLSEPLRDNPLARLFARRRIKEHQRLAGERIQTLFEVAGYASVRAMDPLKEPVDGRGATVDPISDRQMRAYDQLEQIKVKLGERNFALVRLVIAERQFIEKVAKDRGLTRERDVLALGATFRDCLDDLAVYFRLTGRAPARREPRDKYSDMAKIREAA
jgi:hypothetical protein